MLMRLTSKIACAAAIASAIALTVSAADARPLNTARFNGAYAYSGPYHGRSFVYGANHAPYGGDEDIPRDFQLLGTH
jgi:poly(3-hydroxybutyrate) depolymerase